MSSSIAATLYVLHISMDICFNLTTYIQIMVLNFYFSTTILCSCPSHLKQFCVFLDKFHNFLFLDVIFNNKIPGCIFEVAVIAILRPVELIL